MKSKAKGVKITLGGRSFVIGCEEDKREILTAAVNMVEDRLDEVQKNGKVIGLDRCALLAALNIASDLLEERTQVQSSGDLGSQLQRISTKIDAAIEEQNQLSL